MAVRGVDAGGVVAVALIAACVVCLVWVFWAAHRENEEYKECAYHCEPLKSWIIDGECKCKGTRAP